MFGKPIKKLEERDIDLLLLEEFHVSEGFMAWFCGQAGLQNVAFKGAWHSVTDYEGESDIVLLVRSGSRRTALMIENKIGAPEQEKQAERYHSRGRRLVKEGHADDYLTVILAPRSYLTALPSGCAYHQQLSYEDIANWFGKAGGPRMKWRGDIIRQAIEQQASGYQMQVNAATTAFHLAYWEHLRQHHPHLQMNKPNNKGPESTWIYMRAHTFPKEVTLAHKMDQDVVELCFANRTVQELISAEPDWPEGIIPGQKGNQAVLGISVPNVDPYQGFRAQRNTVDAVLKAARRLLPFGRVLEDAARES